jgi:hypothetical protein
VSLELLVAHELELEAAGHPDPAMAYIRQHATPIELDAWGNPLPLSDGNQDAVDGMTWLLAAPLQRLDVLVRSGTVTDDDVQAVRSVFPQAYNGLTGSVAVDLIEAGPPIESWAECALSVLFQQPIEEVYSGQQQGDPGKGQQQPGNSKPSNDGATQADRRDPSVRG